MKIKAYTLAEVLITVGVIGIVAALIIPVMRIINDRVEETQTSVIEKRLVHGLNVFNNLDNGLSNGQYANSEDFVKGLSKHYKMVQICGKNNIQDCFPYKEIKIAQDEEPIDISKINTPQMLGLNDDYLDPAAFVSASGTPFIVTYKKDCIEDPDSQLKEISECVAGIYDYNGARHPNTYGVLLDKDGKQVSGGQSDIKSFNGARIKSACLAKSSDICIATVINQTKGLNKEECIAYRGKDDCDLTIRQGYKDHWAWALQTCEKYNSHMASDAELAKIAQMIYTQSNGEPVEIGAYESVIDTTYDNGQWDKHYDGFRRNNTNPLAKQIRTDINYWTSDLHAYQHPWNAHNHKFDNRRYYKNRNNRTRSDFGVICIGN